jgi:uncharacterized membrane protein YebE (DUF533 family)
MDTIKILGSLLSNNAMGSQVGGSILDMLLTGKGGNAGSILGTLLGGRNQSSNGGLGALGAILAAVAQAQLSKGSTGANAGGGGAADILGSLLGGGGQGSAGGLGGLLAGMLGGAGASGSGANAGGGLGDLIGGLLGGGASPQSAPADGGALGDLVGSLLGGSGAGALAGMLGQASPQASGSELLGILLGGGAEAEPPAEAQQEAELLIEAMCHAAKSDGQIDAAEKEAILGKAGDLTAKEVAFLKEKLSGPVDVAAFTKGVPASMAEQVYAFSLMAIKLDTRKEAEYFAKLAQGLKLNKNSVGQIHSQLGQPEMFA